MKAKSETSFMLVKTEKPMQKKVKMEAKKDKKTKKRIQDFLHEKQKTTDTPQNNYT